jgi:16S rRNA (cytidine1402-2'-O)-methyltransferase
LQRLQTSPHALVFYETPHRIVEMVAALREVFGDEREIILAREVTKKFENIHRVKLADAVTWLESDSNHVRGEFVVIVENSSISAAPGAESAQQQALERTLVILCAELPLKQAVALAVKLTGAKKNLVYGMALAMKGVGDEAGEEGEEVG